MAENNNRKKFRKERGRIKEGKPKWHEDLKQETKHSILAIISFALAIIFILTAFGKAGLIGRSLYNALNIIFGTGFFLIPILCFLLGISFLTSFRTRILAVNLIGGIIFLASSLGLIETIFSDKTGGYFGYFISFPLLKFFDIWAALIILAAFLIISMLMIFNISLRLGQKKDEAAASAKGGKIPEETEPEIKNAMEEEAAAGSAKKEDANLINQEVKKNENGDKKVFEAEAAAGLNIFGFGKKAAASKIDSSLPPLELLEGDRGKPNSGDIKANSNIIKRTLQNFGVEVEMGEINIGPSVTQYTLKPAQGIKLAKITALSNDLALALASHPIRIEAPIPGRSLVGIEVPNRAVSLVGLKSLVSSEEFQTIKAPLLLCLGRNVAGQAIYADLGKMPHLLIAGATGSGKSVCIHSLITSLFYRNTAKNLRFLIIDPKRVELANYSGIPHLLAPVIIDAKKTILALRWATKEMERRYEILSANKVRDINSYKELAQKNGEEDEMPFLVIIIDELADIMAVYPRELEASIVRLAQMSRAVGIHLIVSTQRPSVEVITGLIKANITSRIAFQVASQVDSRTILDMAGAEKLLGNGDMLFLSGDSSKPRRIQGAFVSEPEVKRVTAYLEEEGGVELAPADLELGEKSIDSENTSPSIFDGFENPAYENDDELYEEARNVVIEAKRASASYLQRRLKIGYARAARLLDIMEEKGIIGPVDGAKPREVYVQQQKEI